MSFGLWVKFSNFVCDVNTLGFDLQLGGGRGAGHGVGGDALVHPGVTGDQAEDLERGAPHYLQ